MPVAHKKDNELKAHLEDNKLDLSLMQHDVLSPTLIRQIGALPKATELDLSCNRLQSIPPQFCQLSQITHLDLSKNAITELPEEIKQMTGLRHLDLSGNKIVSLPLGFGALENLRWLDLKDNPLEAPLAAVAGDCLDKKQCSNAAKQVCVYMRTLADAHERAMEKKKKKKENLDEKKQRKKEDKEKAIREEQKEVKRLEKEKKRKEYEEKRTREQKLVENIGPMGDKGDTDSETEAELSRRKAKNHKSSCSSSSSWLSGVFGVLKLFLLLALVSVALTCATVGWCQGSRRQQSPLCASARDVVGRLRDVAPKLVGNFDFDHFCDSVALQTKDAQETAKIHFQHLSAAMRPYAEKVFVYYDERVAPFLAVAGEKSHCFFCHAFESASNFFFTRIQPTLKEIYLLLKERFTHASRVASEFFESSCRPTLIVVRDRVVEVFMLLVERAVFLCDVYIFPGCEKLFASATDILQSLKTTTTTN